MPSPASQASKRLGGGADHALLRPDESLPLALDRFHEVRPTGGRPYFRGIFETRGGKAPSRTA